MSVTLFEQGDRTPQILFGGKFTPTKKTPFEQLGG